MSRRIEIGTVTVYRVIDNETNVVVAETQDADEANFLAGIMDDD